MSLKSWLHGGKQALGHEADFEADEMSDNWAAVVVAAVDLIDQNPLEDSLSERRWRRQRQVDKAARLFMDQLTLYDPTHPAVTNVDEKGRPFYMEGPLLDAAAEIAAIAELATVSVVRDMLGGE